MLKVSKYLRLSSILYIVLALLVLVLQQGCMSKMSLGQGGSMVTGSATDTTELAKAKTNGESTSGSTSQGEAKELTKCDKPIATVALSEDPTASQQYSHVLVQNKLPSSPLPLLRLMFQQSNCFQIVDRGRGLTAITREQELAKQGLLKQDDSVTKKGQLVSADYTIVPNIIFAEENAGGAGGLAGALLPGVAGILGGIKVSKKEAQVLLFLTDNRTGIQVTATEGSAKSSDIAIGGFGVGGALSSVLGAAAGAWGNTNQGKVVAAALLDATNKMVDIIRSL